MFYGEPEQKPDEQINERARATAAAAMTSAATVGLPPTDAGQCLSGKQRRAENDDRSQDQTSFQEKIGNRQSAMLHFNSIRGPSANSFGFSPVGGSDSASSFPSSRNPLMNVSAFG